MECNFENTPVASKVTTTYHDVRAGDALFDEHVRLTKYIAYGNIKTVAAMMKSQDVCWESVEIDRCEYFFPSMYSTKYANSSTEHANAAECPYGCMRFIHETHRRRHEWSTHADFKAMFYSPTYFSTVSTTVTMVTGPTSKVEKRPCKSAK